MNCRPNFVHSSCSNLILCSFVYLLKYYLILQYQPCVTIFLLFYPQGGLNALNLAALNGHLDVVKYLIPKFADRRFESDNYGNTCLHCAAQDGHLAVVKYLIEECGFDPGTGNKVGYCMVHTHCT